MTTTFKATIGVGSYRRYGYRRRVVGVTAIGVVAIDFPTVPRANLTLDACHGFTLSGKKQSNLNKLITVLDVKNLIFIVRVLVSSPTIIIFCSLFKVRHFMSVLIMTQ